MNIYLIILFCFVFWLKTHYAQSEQITYFADYEVSNDTSKNEKYKMVMTLPKTIYKQYEPVVAKFEVINNDTLPLGIYDIFWTEANYLRTINTIDNLGKVYNVNQTPGDMIVIYKNPSYTVMPGDTFIISMPINNWGKYIYGYPLFGQFGYFPAGFSYETKFYNEQFSSNTVNFEVIELNKNDSILIDDLSQLPVENNTLKNYKESIFFEHIYAKYFLTTEQNYYDFLKIYPNTFYMYYDFYMSILYNTLINYNNNIDNIVINIQNNISSDQFRSFLNNKSIVKRIEEILKNFKPHTKKKSKLQIKVYYEYN